jgi:predicted RNA binding protein YcfA (HicA-like mRNA interferase family)
LPRKKRQIKQDLRQLGFIENARGGKGSHSKWTHPLLPGFTVVVSGHDGEGAKPYDETAVRQAIKLLGALS